MRYSSQGSEQIPPNYQSEGTNLIRDKVSVAIVAI